MAKAFKIKNLQRGDPPHKAAVRILRTRLKEYFSHWPDPDSIPTTTELHDLRISGKRLRYSAEALRDYYPDRLALLIQLLKDSQDLLGQVQDCAAQRRALQRDLVRIGQRSPRGAEQSAIRRLIGEYDQRQAHLFIQFEEIWRGLSEHKFRKQLTTMVSRPLRHQVGRGAREFRRNLQAVKPAADPD